MSEEDFERAKELFAQIILEHINDLRAVTTLTIKKHEDRLRIIEDVQLHA